MMRADLNTISHNDYQRIAHAIRYIGENVEEQPDLETVAAEAGLSPFHFQRLFRRWVGISPKRYLQFLSVQRAKVSLARTHSIIETAWEVGLSGPSRLHDHFVVIDAVTPGEYKQAGSGLEIVWGMHPSPFGEMLLALTQRGICYLTFIDESDTHEPAWELERAWPRAALRRSDAATAATAERLFTPAIGEPDRLPVLVKGTNFQVKVWEALLTVPFGARSSYSEIAERIGNARARRAVGNAVGANPIAWLIPCHRVLRNDGSLGGYALGPDRKRAMLAWESARQLQGSASD